METRSPSDEIILSLTREGRSDAEIAVRLGLNVGQVRERRERLLATAPDTNASTGPRPARTPPTMWRKPPRWLLVAGGAFATAWVAFALYLKLSDDGAKPPAKADDSTVSLGRVVLTPRGEAIKVDQRAAMTVLTVPEGTIIHTFDPQAWSESWSFTSIGQVLTGEVGDNWVSITFSPLQNANFIRQPDGGVKVIRGGRNANTLDPPTIFVQATDVTGGGLRSVFATVDGTVSVVSQPIPMELALDAVTGAQLDVSRATRVGKANFGPAKALPGEDDVSAKRRGLGPPGKPANYCASEDGVTCRAAWFPRGPLTAMSEADVACTADRALTLTLPERRYTVRVVSMTPSALCPGYPDQPKSSLGRVSAGAYLGSPGFYSMTATGISGDPVSVAIALDGTVYIGDIRTTAGCPCLPFN